jgi:hypothetical protein
VQVAPAHEGIELGIGDAILLRALAQATGRQEAQLKKEYDDLGDLGEVACNSKSKQRTIFQPKPLTIRVSIVSYRLRGYLEICFVNALKVSNGRRVIAVLMYRACTSS